MPRSILLKTLVGALTLVACGGCAYTKKKIAPKQTYRAHFSGSSDGIVFIPLMKLIEFAETAKPLCQAINRSTPVKAQYDVERKDSGIAIKFKDCEGNDLNCAKVEQCLRARPVAWMSRATGLRGDLAGVLYTDWLGRCGGNISVRFYYGPENDQPIERVGCAEPKHDTLDIDDQFFFVTRPEVESTPPAGPFIERLLQKWNSVVFGAASDLPAPTQ